MKKITISAVLLFSTIFANAQCDGSNATNSAEDFESADSYPTTKWDSYDEAFSYSWNIAPVSAYGTGGQSAQRIFMDDPAEEIGSIDFLYSWPTFNLSNGPFVLEFDVAYAPYDGSRFDELKISINPDCFTSDYKLPIIFSKSGTDLATAPATTSPFVPTNSEWRHETVSLEAYNGETNFAILFQAISGQGNALYLDNISVNQIAPSQPGSISGSDVVCQNSAGNVYSVVDNVFGADTYTWTVPSGASITSGQGTSSITVTFGTSIGDITVTADNETGSSPASTFAVTSMITKPSQPGTMTGLGTVCANAEGLLYSIVPVAGADSYTWTVPVGASITAGQGTPDVTVTWNASSGTISVVAENACGSSTVRNKTISIGSTKPATPSSITGPTSSCEYGTSAVPYSCPLVSGASSYLWTVPSGVTILTGQGTNNITVSFGSGFTSNGPITVAGVNDCGTGTAKSKQVYELPKNPGVITGPKDICVSGLTGNNYSVSSAIVQGGPVTYTWTMPAGATLVSGQGTKNIVVDFASNFTQAVIKCAATNSCGSSSASSITVGYIPKLPGISGLNSVCPNSTNNYTATGLVSATSYAWTVPAGATLNSGQGTATISVTFGATAGKITCVASNACGSSGTKSYTVGLATCKDGGIFASNEGSGDVVEDVNADEVRLSVYPNPATKGTMINLNVQGLTGQDQIATINVYDMIGKIVYTENLSIQNNAPVMLSNELNSGLFFIEIQIENKTIREKLIVNK